MYKLYSSAWQMCPPLSIKTPEMVNDPLLTSITGFFMHYGYLIGMGDTCKFHSIRFQVLSTKYRNHFDTIMSTFDYHGYLLQIYQQLSEYNFVGVQSIILLNNFKVNSHVIISIEISILSEKYSIPKYRVL